MELNIKFDGRVLIAIAISIVCVIGLYQGAVKTVYAQEELSQAQTIKETMIKIKNKQIKVDDLPLQEALMIAALGMQLGLNPQYLEQAIEYEQKELYTGIGILVVSIMGFMLLALGVKKSWLVTKTSTLTP
ncbi:hypothetical protein [Methylophilus sp. DW102]|uniref:hypothetical protein n=1 Tax=Methylophilus sp. DW102 TaxID=3095607 RepID=UPI003093C361|nr:hypothetical protein MTDW_18260 [Methylophilus sp. DW102]